MSVLSSLNSLLGNQPSLMDYLDGGRLSGSAAVGNSSAQQILSGGMADSASGDTVSISPAAQQLLDQIKAKQGVTGADGTTTNGVKKAAQNFITGFFTDSGVDTTKLSAETQKLLQGFQDMIGNSDTKYRDTVTDIQEGKYNNGDRKVYTLVGDERRIRVAIDYKDGKPQNLTLTDISSDGQVDTATVSFTKKDGILSGVDVNQTQYKYTHGSMTDSLTKPVLSLDLYKTETGTGSTT